MISQEVSWKQPTKPQLRPISQDLPSDEKEFLLQQELSSMSLEDSSSSHSKQDFQFKITEEDTVDQASQLQSEASCFKRSHRSMQESCCRARTMLGRLQRLDRIPAKKRHF